MQFRNIVLIKLFLIVLCINYCNNAFAEQLHRIDSLQINEYHNFKTVEAKMNWLLKNDLNEVNAFVKRNHASYSLISEKIIKGNNAKLKYQYHFLEGLLNYHQSHFQRAIPLLLNTLAQKEFVSQEDSVKIIIDLKTCFERLLIYPKVFEMHSLLLAMSKRNPRIKKRNLGIPLSEVYTHMGLINEGIMLLKAEYQDTNKISDQYAKANFLNNLGVLWHKGNKPDSAIYYFKQSQSIVKEFLNKDTLNKYCIFFDGLLAGNIGQALIMKKQINEAVPLLKKDIYCSLSTGNLQNAAISYNELAQCFFELKSFQLAEIYLDSSLNILKEIDAPHEYLKNLKLRAELLGFTGRYQQSMQTYQKYNRLNDSIAANEKELLMLNQQISFQTNELKEKIDLQDKEMVSKELLEERRNTQRILLFVLLLSLLTILIFVYYSYDKSKKRNKLLSEKNEEIIQKSEMLSATLKEKELLIKEVHHRVKNNMQIIISLLRLQAEKINDSRVEMYFLEARNRIQSMALIHEFLYKKEKMDFLQMDKYIIQLTSEIQKSHEQPNFKIDLITDCDEILLDFDTSIPLGLIVNELVTNAYKHAFPTGIGKIWVSLKNSKVGYTLCVKDNGAGTPENFEDKKEKSLGMELIELLSAQINAQVELKHHDGFEVRILIPSALKTTND